MYITFVGLSGSGKSTTSRGVRNLLNDKGLYTFLYHESFFKPTDGLIYKTVWSLYLWVFFDRRLFLGLLLVPRRRAKEKGKKFKWSYAYLPLKLKYHLNQLKNNRLDVVLVEEDMVTYSAISNQEVYISNNEVIETFKESILPNSESVLQVFVDTPPALATERYCYREKIYDDNVKEKEIDFRNDCYKKMKTIVSALDGVDGVHTVVVDGTRSPEENIKQVVEVALDLLEQKSS